MCALHAELHVSAHKLAVSPQLCHLRTRPVFTGQRQAWPKHGKQCRTKPSQPPREAVDSPTEAGSEHSAIPKTGDTKGDTKGGTQEVGFLNKLSDDLLLEIFWKLSAADLARCSCVSARWRTLCSTTAIWNVLCNWQDVSNPSSGVSLQLLASPAAPHVTDV